MSDQDQPGDISQVPVLIFVPGLGGAEANSADRLAEVVATVADTLDGGGTFGTKTTSVTAPSGLTVGKTVVDGADQPRLQLFQFDYASVLAESPSTAFPSVAPGMVRSAVLAGVGFWKWFRALRRKAKTARTKWQLFLGLVAGLVPLIIAAAVAMYAFLLALSIDVSWVADAVKHLSLLEALLGPNPTPRLFGFASLGLTISWALLRKKALALADSAETLIRFTENYDQKADDITFKLDQAIDELRRTWKGPLHLVGYSFGSLVLFEALYPRANARMSPKPVAPVSSLVTIGCPLDLVRLFEPSYDKGRKERKENLRWTNIFNAADIFASNLRNGNDKKDGVETFTVGTARPHSIRYTDEEIGLLQVFVNGRTHSSYWGEPDEANCLGELVSQWLAVRVP
ncbi:hypothetical protein QFZ65_002616 [Arthrobacter sp. B3I9]|uniref:hypothetical protein n=1 Tax=Arthrobacter sp. B3I9 TaxID=3042270 RepID=UPI002792B02C|nr:hypothetical protein [Arthrobacter sp. B3I9]MDQ0850678.1 hypothetical protein [Arthrobacter sp. B3I9]